MQQKPFNYLTGCITFQILRSKAQTEIVVSRTLMRIIGHSRCTLDSNGKKKQKKNAVKLEKCRKEWFTFNKHFGQANRLL